MLLNCLLLVLLTDVPCLLAAVAGVRVVLAVLSLMPIFSVRHAYRHELCRRTMHALGSKHHLHFQQVHAILDASAS